MNKKRVFLTSVIVLFSLVLFLGALGAGAADEPAKSDFGLKATAEQAGLTTGGEPPGPAALAGKIVGYALAFIGVLFFLLMIYGGFRWMTARGNAELVTKGKDIVEAAVIGIVIVFLAYTVTNFVLTKLMAGTGVKG